MTMGSTVMTAKKDDPKPLVSPEISFHQAVQAVVNITSPELILGKKIHSFSAHDAEELHKAASAIETALGIQSFHLQSANALQLIRALVHDLDVFETADSVSGAELVDYMASFYWLAKSIFETPRKDLSVNH
jgi:hypothetical protein